MKRLFQHICHYGHLFINCIARSILDKNAYARFLGVRIGGNCMIGIRSWSSEPYLITIGNNVAVTRGCQLLTHGGARVARRKYPEFDVFGKITIKDWAYIGTNSLIMPGVTIGEGALVAAGSVVCKSVPDHEVWGGNPAKYICTVEEYIARNLKYNLDCKSLTPQEKRNFLLSLQPCSYIQK